MKYIDSEKLIAEIEKLLARANRRADKEHLSHNSEMEKFGEDYWNGYGDLAYALLGYITSLQQEQPEVNLEKFTEKIKTFQGRYKHPESISIKGAMAFMARMFYQYPNVARKWYDSLPNATMDNERKEK